MKTYNELFANNLKYYLNKRGLSQAELSRQVGSSSGNISEWCSGKKLPGNMATFMKLASALSVTVADLFDVQHNEHNRRVAAYASVIAEDELLQAAVAELVKVPAADLPRVIEMLKIFSKEVDK